MGYILAVEATAFDADALRKLADVRPLAKVAFPVLHQTVMEAVDAVFESQGDPPWEPLAEFTVYERIRLGFGEGPILQRTGALRESFVAESHPLHVFRVDMTETEAVMEVGSSDPRAVPLAEGDPEQNLPARPIFPDETVLASEFEDTIVGLGEALYA